MTDPYVTQFHACRMSLSPPVWEASIIWSDGTVSEARSGRYDDAIYGAWLAERHPIKEDRR